jgi:hypothetical protein
MRTLWMMGLLGLASNGIKDCRKTAAPGTAATSSSVSALAPGSGPVANEKLVTRYPSEKKSEESLTLARDVVAHQSPPDGAMVANLAAGTKVEQLAVMPDGILVVFAGASGERLMGWVDPQSFGAQAVTTAASARLPLVALKTDAGTLVDAGSALGDAGLGVLDAGGTADSGTGGKTDAGLAAKPDAGAASKPDAGAAGRADAGAPVKLDAGVAAGQAWKAAVGARCDAGWTLTAPGSTKCFKICTTDANCPGLRCKTSGAVKFCDH